VFPNLTRSTPLTQEPQVEGVEPAGVPKPQESPNLAGTASPQMFPNLRKAILYNNFHHVDDSLFMGTAGRTYKK
jgi:hypothetical protein